MGRVITDLKLQKKNPNRVNVYLDGQFAFGLARIVAAWLKVGLTLSDDQIQSLQEKDSQEVALQTALKFLSYRYRSEIEVKNNLLSHGFSESVIDQVVSHLKESKIIGDKQFSIAWIENRTTFRPRGQRLLKSELKQKGVKDEIIQEVLADAEGDEVLAIRLAQRKAPQLKSLDFMQFSKKLGSYLMRRGFTYDVVRPVVHRVWEEIKEVNTDILNNGNEEFCNE
jgi:regulatory protein